MDLAPVLDELYGLDPAEFTARRDALSAEARKSGEREAATAIKALRRPSAAAYVVNLMARARENDIARLLELGGQMRQAQEALSGDDLRALGRQRQQLIGGMAGEARRLAAESGHPVSESVAREVEATFEAALADPWAGEAVRAGRLVRSLHRSGMDPVDLTGAVAGPAGAAGPPPTRAKTAGPAPTDERAKPKSRPATDERAAEAEAAARRQDAEAELARARKAESEAARRLEEATARHEAARQRQAEAERAVEELQDRLAAACDEVDEAATAERAARRERLEAEEAGDRVGTEVRRAAARLEARPS